MVQPGRIIVEYDDGKPHSSVKTAGQFTNWVPIDLGIVADTKYSAVFDGVPAHESFPYKFIVDGEWILLPGLTSKDDGSGNFNHIIVSKELPEVTHEPVGTDSLTHPPNPPKLDHPPVPEAVPDVESKVPDVIPEASRGIPEVVPGALPEVAVAPELVSKSVSKPVSEAGPVPEPKDEFLPTPLEKPTNDSISGHKAKVTDSNLVEKEILATSHSADQSVGDQAVPSGAFSDIKLDSQSPAELVESNVSSYDSAIEDVRASSFDFVGDSAGSDVPTVDSVVDPRLVNSGSLTTLSNHGANGFNGPFSEIGSTSNLASTLTVGKSPETAATSKIDDLQIVDRSGVPDSLPELPQVTSTPIDTTFPISAAADVPDLTTSHAVTVETSTGTVIPERIVPDLAVPEPTVSEPIVPESDVPGPVITDPIVSEPVVSEPIASEPIVSKPVVAEPVSPSRQKHQSIDINTGFPVDKDLGPANKDTKDSRRFSWKGVPTLRSNPNRRSHVGPTTETVPPVTSVEHKNAAVIAAAARAPSAAKHDVAAYESQNPRVPNKSVEKPTTAQTQPTSMSEIARSDSKYAGKGRVRKFFKKLLN